MVILLDIGNTNIKIGILNGEKITETWRIATDSTKTADEFGMVFFDLLQSRNLTFDMVDGIILSSVTPSLNYTIEHMCTYYIKKKPIIVSCHTILGLGLDYLNPEEIGADRLVNAVAAYNLYGAPCITVDFGSATTFGVVSPEGVFLGGAIAPGIKSSMEALVNSTAKLPRIELNRPANIIGKSTIQNMQSGIINGFIGLVNNIVIQIKKETGYHNAKVIATGGMSELVVGNNSHIDIVDRSLSLKGLKILYSLNK